MKNRKRTAIIGGGISGISLARMLAPENEVRIFEKGERVGGLLACESLEEGLYHKLGGHVFNTKNEEVSEWFWKFFDREKEFYSLSRNSQIYLNDTYVHYPIENSLWQLPEATVKAVLEDLLELSRQPAPAADNFQDFLLGRFGRTLCELYFFPYNRKMWGDKLGEIPLEWLEGKLPMPSVQEILEANILRSKEEAFVHARFFYPRQGGSQFIIDRLADGLDIRTGVPVERLERRAEGWHINEGAEVFDQVVYTGDVRALDRLWPEMPPVPAFEQIKLLRTRGISNAFCRCDSTDVSWLYLPEEKYRANRIINTGSFSPANNQKAACTCVVEFAYGEAAESIHRDIQALPGNLEKLAENHVRDAYVIQERSTRDNIAELKARLSGQGLYLLGRFAEWEYYNSDKCMEAAMRTAKEMGLR